MSIKVKSAQKPLVRETTAPFIYSDDNGDPVTENIRVRYYAWTTAKLKEAHSLREKKIAEGGTYWHSDMLADRIESLPDIVDDKGKPVKIDVAFLDTLDIKNLTAIGEAIDNDIRPKSQPDA
jgi:hypothetical protein